MKPTAPSWSEQVPDAFGSPWISGWTGSGGPDFMPHPSLPQFLDAARHLGHSVGLPDLAWADQVHEGTVLYADGPGLRGKADALWTDRPGLGVLGRSADCPLVLVGGPSREGSHVWGFAHASWRSTVANITSGLVRSMVGAGGRPEQMEAIICPSAGPCCYEVGEEVRAAAVVNLGVEAAGFFIERDGSLIMDLWKANTAQLVAAGLVDTNIHDTRICTICHPNRYPSYRRQGQDAGRMAAFLGQPAG